MQWIQCCRCRSETGNEGWRSDATGGLRAYAHRASQCGAACLKDHITRLDWSRQQIEDYQNHRLRALLGYARERSPFHAQRLRELDLSRVSVTELASLPVMSKQDAQEQWDAIVTAPDLDRNRAEHILVEQQWFSYTAGDQQIFSSGGSSGVRGVYVWDWDFFVSGACLAWRVQAREELHRQSFSGPTRPVRPASDRRGGWPGWVRSLRLAAG